MEVPFFRSPYNYDRRQASDEAAAFSENPGESLTVQSMAEDADINVIVHRFGITGKLPDNPRVPSYGDFSEVTDYRSALEAVRNADEAFMELPARVRAEFDNDPQKLLAFASNPDNLPRMRELGLAKEQVYGGAESEVGGAVGGGSGGAAAAAPAAGSVQPSAQNAGGDGVGNSGGGANRVPAAGVRR